MKRWLKDALKRGGFRVYRFGTRLRTHIMPVHYYSPVPDVLELERTRSEWARRSDLPGIHVDMDEQVEAVRTICSPYLEEYRGNATYREAVEKQFGPGYGPIEAQALHSVVRHFKPTRIIEVGSGVSTHCMLTAIARNRNEGGPATALTCVEPYPSQRLQQLKDITLIPRKVQAVSTDVFRELGDGDLLFIDSSHTVKPGGDVNFLFLEVLPRLQPGVLVHVHDIFLPYDYQRNVLKTFLHWSETSLLRAFLTHNDHARIVFSMSMLFYDRPDVLKEVFPEINPQPAGDGLLGPEVRPFEHGDAHFPSSIYFRTQ